MRRLFGFFTLSVLLANALPALQAPADCGQCIAQNIFDEDTGANSEVAEKPATNEETGKSKSTGKLKKKKKSRKKKKQAAQPAPSVSESQEFTPQELARQSYAWAPEPGLRLKSTAPGIKPAETAVPAKAAAPAPAEVLETPVQPQGFKLPQIPVTQVLIVAGFVILFLIYRFRVGRQIKRKKY